MNRRYYRDNLDVLRQHIPSESVDFRLTGAVTP